MPLGDGITWSESVPTDGTTANLIDDYDRDLRIGVRSRLALEHNWPAAQSATSEAGQHTFITLKEQAAKPTIAGTQLAAVYCKTVGAGLQEVFFENELGTEVQLTSRNSTILPAGSVVQVVNTSYGEVVTGATILPSNDTIPTNAEGSEVSALDTTIIPKSATNKLRIDVTCYMGASTSGVQLHAALYQDSGAAIAVGSGYSPEPAGTASISFSYFMVANTTSATTFKIRIGSNFGTVYLNGKGSLAGRVFGGVAMSSVTVTEIKA